jgi:hypothetical protein
MSLYDTVQAGHGHGTIPPGRACEDLAGADKTEISKLSAFYADILPKQGYFCLFLIPESRHIWAESHEELTALTEQYADRTGLYCGTTAFETIANRKQANVLALRSLRLDIDAGAKKYAKDPDHTYPTQLEALAAFAAFTKASGLAPSYLIASGEGLHVYYCLADDVTPAVWLPMAEGLAQLTTEHGLKVDSTVTKDTVRILRPPGSMHGNGKLVTILKRTGRVYQPSELPSAMVLPAPSSAPRRSSINDDIVGSGAFQGPPSSALKVAEHCGALREVAQSRGDVSEPLWRAMIGLVKRTVEGLDIAHEWSSGYDGYDSYEVERKFNAWSTGPTTCSEFAKHSTACSSCGYRGKVKSPIMLGMDRQAGSSVALAGEVNLTRAALKGVLPDWRVNAEGEKISPHNTVRNVSALAQYAGGGIRHNVMTRRTELTRPGLQTPRDDNDNTALALFGDVAVRAGMARDGLAELVDAAAGDKPYHPVQAWVTATAWDGIPRREVFHSTLELVDADKAPLSGNLVDAWSLQAIGALVEPDGIAAQGLLVLNGPQDANKTRWVENLCSLPGAVRTGLHIDPANKDSLMQATSSWIGEAGELDSTTRRSDVSMLKAFFTRREDVIRPAYARRENIYRRRTVFVGTVNGTGFLVDETGNRRYWTLEVKRCHLLPPEVMQQIWAEYYAMYMAGERWHLDAETKAALNASNIDHTAVDPLRERIATRFDWDSVDWDTVDPDNWRAFPQVLWLSATEVCVLSGVERPTRVEATRTGGIVRDMQRVSGRVSLDTLHRKSNGAKLLAVPSKMNRRL